MNQLKGQVLTRKQIELYFECPRTFYFEFKHGIKPPRQRKHTLDLAVKKLLKKEFDLHRADKSVHPIMKEYGIDALPFSHNDLGNWRETYNGLQTFHGPTDFIVSGNVDDVWHTPRTELIVVEYRSQTPDQKHTKDPLLDKTDGRQLEIYQWILKQKGHEVAPKAYFVQCIGLTDRKAFDAKLEFDLKLIEHDSDLSWVEDTLLKIRETVTSKNPPEASQDSPWYNYYLGIKNLESSLN